MTEKEYLLRFYTPVYDESCEEEGVFGCASLGLASKSDWILPDEPAVMEFGKKVKGILINADLSEACAQLDMINADVKGGIVLFGNCGGENAFMKKLAGKFPGVPFAGGSPAIGEDGKIKRMLPASKEVSVLLITDDRYDISVSTLNVYGEVVAEAEVTEGGERNIRTVSCCGKTADFYTCIQKIGEEKGVDAGLTERVSISDMSGRNIHLIADGDSYVCGADLPEDGRIQIRYSTKENVCDRMKDFYSAEDSLIFGCAGVKTNIGDMSFETGAGSLGMFMFGEVVTIDGAAPDFANLMLTRLTLSEK